MRPRFIMLLLLLLLAFLLVLMLSPGFWHRKELGRLVVVRHQSPTPENVQAVEHEQAKMRRQQYVVCGLVVLNVMAIIIYGAAQQRKGAI